MFWPWKSTSPSTRAIGIVSCIRLRQRSRVDFPQPEGPMIAVTPLARKPSDTSRTALVAPKNAESPRVRIASAGSVSGARAGAIAGEEARAADAASVMATADASARHDARDDADDQHESDEHQRARPGLRVPLVVRADGVGEYLQGERGDRLVHLGGPELVAERGEEQRRRLTRDTCDGDEHASDDAPEGRAEHDLERGAPSGIAERERCLAQRLRHGAHHLLRRS